MAGQQGRPTPRRRRWPRAVPEPAPGAGDRSGVPGQRLLRRPGRGPGQYEMVRKVKAGRRPGHRGRRGVRVLPARLLRRGRRAGILGLEGLVPAGPGRAAPHKLTERDPRLGRAAAGRPPRPAPGAAAGLIQESFGVRVHPRSVERALARRRERHSKSRGTDRPRDAEGGSPVPAPAHHHLATRLLNRAPAWMPARTPPPAAGWTPATSNSPCRPARARRGVPARARRAHQQGRHRLAACPGQPGPRRTRPGGTSPPRPAALPAPVAAELISALAAVALAGPSPARPRNR